MTYNRFNTYNSRKQHSYLWLIILAALAVVLGIFLWGKAYYGEDVHSNCVVTDKDRTSKSNGGSDMRVYTENCGNFTVADAWLKGEFSSSDTYAKIEPGHTYDFTTIGWRVPFFSMFPNILEAEEAS